MKLGSLFDGIGGFPLSAIQHGIEPVWASEVEPFPIAVTKKYFPNMKHLGDITQINGAEIEPVEIITGGSPCQDLSVAGKRAGLAGERSGLFMEQVRIVKEMREHDRAIGRTSESIRPRFMVWENVPGAFSSNGGEDFRAVLEETARIADETVTIPRPRDNKWDTAGAIMGRNFSIAWRVLDAQYWGAPQRRRRIFLVADFAGHSAGEILFKCESVSGDIAKGGETGQRVAATVGTGIEDAIAIDAYNHAVTGDIAVTLTASGPMRMVAPFNTGQITSPQNGNKVEFGLPCHTLSANEHPPSAIISYSMKSSNPHSGIYEADTSRTIDQNGGNPGCNQGGMAIVQTFSFQRSDEFKETDKASTQSRRQYKDATDLVVTQPTYALDRASFSQGRNAQYDFQIADDDKTQTLVSSGPNAVAEPPRYSVRRLTPLECERLQGFPDGWTNIPPQAEATAEDLSFWREVWDEWQEMNDKKLKTDKQIIKWLQSEPADSARYKALGNSVAVPCVTWIMGQIVTKGETP